MIKSLKLTNFLSFGPESPAVALGPLNVLIGPNGSGKSNFLAALDVLKNAPEHIERPMRQGGVREWLWRGKSGEATVPAGIKVVLDPSVLKFFDFPFEGGGWIYLLSFGEVNRRLEVCEERIEREKALAGEEEPIWYYRFDLSKDLGDDQALIRAWDPTRGWHVRPVRSLKFDSSILAQRRDPDLYPEVTTLAEKLSEIYFFRDWTFGSQSACRSYQRADLSTVRLEPNAENLALVVHRLARNAQVKARMKEALHSLYEGIDDFDVELEGGAVQIFFREGDTKIPATRLSDGTLRYLALLAVLCDPNPPPLVCIEEPELGLHPDALATIAELLQEASERCQVIVTTHSELLVDAFHDKPDVVLVCEKSEKGSVLQRLNAEELKPWLEQYRLGDYWMRGGIGGTRW